jgi:hypothetical protein
MKLKQLAQYHDQLQKQLELLERQQFELMERQPRQFQQQLELHERQLEWQQYLTFVG